MLAFLVPTLLRQLQIVDLFQLGALRFRRILEGANLKTPHRKKHKWSTVPRAGVS